MTDYLEFEQENKALKSINLDDFSLEELNEYIVDLKNEIERVKAEIVKKSDSKTEAEKFFK
tara:strand:- start:193 stop:375 length:183 start_codon:yes stop_codon:yes gene_type:complete